MWSALKRQSVRLAEWLCMAAAVVSAILAGTSDVQAARRAFIVGNANYTNAAPLANPLNDARDLAARLTDVGWQVTLQLDVSRNALLGSFASFARDLQPDDLSLFFFAGHAVQIGGENYLAPVDARVESEEGIRKQFVALNSILADLSRLSRSRIVILDACRDNPLAEGLQRAGQGTRSVGASKGLARVYAGVGSFIVFSTQPGNVALDGTGRNSPFTKSLLTHMASPKADVHAVMRRVRADVQHDTQEQQVPWENSSLIDEVAFATDIVPAPIRQAEVPPTARDPGASSTARNTQATPPQPSAPIRPAPRLEQFHYIGGLDPKGDNFLALRTGPTPDDVRIATMGPDTLVKVRESQGPWRRVELTDGMSGWAHSNWIKCCRTAPAVSPSAEPAVARPSRPPAAPAGGSPTCDDLWFRRNVIWHAHGYCFTTARGRAAFDTSTCFRDQSAARTAMSSANRATVDALLAQERALGCK
jgi:hypothetical protein